MLASIKSVKRWVAKELDEIQQTVFELPPTDINGFHEKRGRWLTLKELQTLLTENEDAEEPASQRKEGSR